MLVRSDNIQYPSFLINGFKLNNEQIIIEYAGSISQSFCRNNPTIKRINENNNFISEALDLIPLEGKIYKSDYNNFVSLFQKAFPDGGSGIAIGSRLLTMKRPDYFVCLDKQNRPKLCEEFGIAQNISFDDYWDEIIERILNSVWWSSERPDDPIEIQAWQGRSAMLDAIFYEERIA